MIDIRQIKEQQKDIHPGFGSYLECMTRGLFTGLSGFCLCKYLYLNHFKPKNYFKIKFQPFLLSTGPKKLVKIIYHIQRNSIFLFAVLLEQLLPLKFQKIVHRLVEQRGWQ